MIRRLAKLLKMGKKGYTLIEVAAVVAVTSTITAVAVPIVVDMKDRNKLSAAREECQKIAGAIADFVHDTGQWPAYYGTGTGSTYLNYWHVLRTGAETGNLGTGHDPVNAATLWNEADPAKIDLLENHLVKDCPRGTCPGAYLNTVKLAWKGPYSESFIKKTDPWGNNYLVYVKAMYTPTTETTGGENKQYGWIISAGPNGTLETDVIHSYLQGDDIGVMLFAAETGR